MIKFDINVKLTVFTLIFIPILFNLGLWQLSRADEKIEIQKRWQQKREQPAINFLQAQDMSQDSSLNVSLEYQNIQVNGIYHTDKYWLVESQIMNGQLGYHILMPFELGNSRWIVVNRGWVKGGADRRIVPNVAMTPAMHASQSVKIAGHFKQPADSPLIQETLQDDMPWPKKIIETDIKVLSQQFDKSIFPYVLRLNVDEPTALEVNWQPINMKPEKHRGYAFQWFAMTFALFVLWFFSNTNISRFFVKSKYSN